jgi:predicted N-formylglutamate amidohydrolase
VNPAASEEAWTGLGHPKEGGVLIIADHASNFVPMDIDLGIDPALLSAHIALDIGVADVVRLLVNRGDVDTALLGGVSRLVLDLNREPEAAGLIPMSSDGHDIVGNHLDAAARQARIDRFHLPYHDQIAMLCHRTRPLFILSLHSFTPVLSSRKEDRPWDLGVLYNGDDRLARFAIPLFISAGLNVGDQLPYSGKDLNYTMNRHAEANAIPYLGLEMRQDHVADAAGQARFAEIIGPILEKCRHHLA